jgi:hypothetical protein
MCVFFFECVEMIRIWKQKHLGNGDSNTRLFNSSLKRRYEKIRSYTFDEYSNMVSRFHGSVALGS